MKRLLEVPGAFYELLRLGIITRFRFKGPYWQWRLHTAFGRGYPESRWELWKSAYHYGRWVWRLRSR